MNLRDIADEDSAAAASRRLAELNLRLQEEIQRHRLFERRLLKIAESEARRLALELHEGLGQHLSGLAFLAGTLAGGLAQDGHARAADAEWVVRLLNEATRKARALARGLAPIDLEHGSLVRALQGLGEDLEALHGISFALHAADEPRLGSPVALRMVFRIVNEAAANAVRHGRARRVTVRLESAGDDFLVSVHNDGLAFDPATVARERGTGLAGMQLRAEVLGAELSIEPLPAGGTEVVLLLPGASSSSLPGQKGLLP